MHKNFEMSTKINYILHNITRIKYHASFQENDRCWHLPSRISCTNVSLAHATDVEVTPIPESEINYDLDLTIDLSDIDAEEIANVQDEIKAMEEAEDPYLYFDGLPDLEQRSIIAAMDQGQVNIKDPDEVWGYELEQDLLKLELDNGDAKDDERKYDAARRQELRMEAKEMAQCLKWVSSFDCKEAFKLGRKVEAHVKLKYSHDPDSLVDGQGDAYRHCLWSASMRISLGYFSAEYVAANHETMNREEARMNGENMAEFEVPSRMDTFNNAQGRVVGAAFAESRDYTGAAETCDLWSRTGMLKTLF